MALFKKLQPDFHSVCTEEFHGKVVVTIKNKHVRVKVPQHFLAYFDIYFTSYAK